MGGEAYGSQTVSYWYFIFLSINHLKNLKLHVCPGSAIQQVMEKRYAWVATVDNWKVYLEVLYIYAYVIISSSDWM